MYVRACACVCVRVRVREREKEREGVLVLIAGVHTGLFSGTGSPSDNLHSHVTLA